MDLWGRLSARKRSAARAAEASLADFDAARLSLIAQTARAYFRLVEARLQKDLSAQTVASFRDAAQLVRDRYRRSLRPAVDLRLAQAQLAESEALLVQRRRELDAAARQLELLLGRYPRAEPDAAADLSKLPPPIPAGLPSALLARRPDIIAAFKRLRASDARIDAARADLYPRLSLTASGGYTSDELKNLLTGDASVWNLVANLVQPLFNGGRLRAGTDIGEAQELQDLLQGSALAPGPVQCGEDDVGRHVLQVGDGRPVDDLLDHLVATGVAQSLRDLSARHETHFVFGVRPAHEDEHRRSSVNHVASLSSPRRHTTISCSISMPLWS